MIPVKFLHSNEPNKSISRAFNLQEIERVAQTSREALQFELQGEGGLAVAGSWHPSTPGLPLPASSGSSELLLSSFQGFGSALSILNAAYS